MTTSPKVFRKLNLSWGVTPFLCPEYENMDDMFKDSVKNAKDILNLTVCDNVVVTAGVVNGKSGNTNTIKVERVE